MKTLVSFIIDWNWDMFGFLQLIIVFCFAAFWIAEGPKNLWNTELSNFKASIF